MCHEGERQMEEPLLFSHDKRDKRSCNPFPLVYVLIIFVYLCVRVWQAPEECGWIFQRTQREERDRGRESYKKLVQTLVRLLGQHSVGQANSWIFQSKSILPS